MKDRRTKLWTAALAVSAALGLLASSGIDAFVARFWPEAAALDAVSVIGVARLPAADVAAAAGVSAGAPLATLDTAAIASRVGEHPWIRRARVASLPPARLLIAVEEREPAVLARLETGIWWVDAEGVPFAPAAEPAPDLPLVDGAEGAEPGRSHPGLVQAVSIARAVRRRGLPEPRRIRVGGEDLSGLPTLALASPRARLVLGDGDLDAKLERLEQLLAADLPEVAAASSIDLRFGDRMVLRSDASRDGGAAATAHGGASPPEPGPAG